MGTRGLTCAVIDGNFKIAQYGQWDHYPSGQGMTLAKFIQGIYDLGKLDDFKQAVRECRFIDDDESERLLLAAIGGYQSDSEKQGWFSSARLAQYKNAYPQLDRDAGATVLELVMNGTRVLQDNSGFAGESLFCEWAYVVDLDKDMIEVYQGFNKKKPKGRFASLPGDDGYKPVTLFHKFPISDALKGMEETIRKDNGEDTQQIDAPMPPKAIAAPQKQLNG